MCSIVCDTIFDMSGPNIYGGIQGLPLPVPNFLMADPFDPIGAVAGLVGATTGVVQAVSQAMQDFETEVEKNKTKVPSRTYVEWRRKVMEIDGQVEDMITEYNKESKEEVSFWFSSPCPDFKEEMKKTHEKVIYLLRESNEIRDKMLVDRAPEHVIKREGPDIRKFETHRKPLEMILGWLKRHKVKGIGIYGTVGIGKTTVMLNLNNHDQVAKMFDIVIWITISKKGSKENLKREHLQRAIAQRLKLTMAGTSNATKLPKEYVQS
ncbi:hypothetical protein RHGRI_032144 [Rhododendron griersonianum]|uniref:NB-ARC domain-containing protein n=1 Tax=Rhododendron griersonianum TaxID=479676 RepID=A0AAV6IGI1_9ERIC|nr:hypothetical protein RHGRI_032144 [Rhododendron griersonianum]